MTCLIGCCVTKLRLTSFIVFVREGFVAKHLNEYVISHKKAPAFAGAFY